MLDNHIGEPERVIEFTIGEQSGVKGLEVVRQRCWPSGVPIEYTLTGQSAGLPETVTLGPLIEFCYSIVPG